MTQNKTGIYIFHQISYSKNVCGNNFRDFFTVKINPPRKLIPAKINHIASTTVSGAGLLTEKLARNILHFKRFAHYTVFLLEYVNFILASVASIVNCVILILPISLNNSTIVLQLKSEPGDSYKWYFFFIKNGVNSARIYLSQRPNLSNIYLKFYLSFKACSNRIPSRISSTKFSFAISIENGATFCSKCFITEIAR